MYSRLWLFGCLMKRTLKLNKERVYWRTYFMVVALCLLGFYTPIFQIFLSLWDVYMITKLLIQEHIIILWHRDISWPELARESKPPNSATAWTLCSNLNVYFRFCLPRFTLVKRYSNMYYNIDRSTNRRII